MRYPDRTALWVDDCKITYYELFVHAAGIARGLQEVGSASPRCALLGTSTASSFAGIAGAVLAGATYVPLNPRQPPFRLALVLEKAGAEALVVDDSCSALACDVLATVGPSMLVILLDSTAPPGWAATLGRHRFLYRGDLRPRAAPAVIPRDPDCGAYLLFTSGSTGEPKGVLVKNRNVIDYLRSVADRYGPSPEDRFIQLFDFSFDLSVHNLFLCWSAGAALYCPPEASRMAPHEFVRRHSVTFWFSVPSTASFMSRLHVLRPGAFPTLRWSLFCGEALPTRLAQIWAAAAPNSVVENLYGPTEATIAFTAYRLPSDAKTLARLPETVPIGWPFPGQQALVVKEDGVLASLGESGELYLAGTQITDGYLDRPDLTAERFGPLPGYPGFGGRWYRTGDLAEMTAEHGLVFLGRVDRQAKIAGYRVELEEVEAMLRRAACCDSVAAIAWPIAADGTVRGIVAFVAGGARGDELILEECRQRLPPYMIPSALHRVPAWPLNANGKTDYARLRWMVE
ncbi:MAG: amino acid adenylation domain-containing protein [Acetobacteraceae bacterium]|nr:amino acid adenylation domain-containing protein [Acetobacteraceae bacterium]